MDEDMTLETLLSVREEICPHLSEELLRQCYFVQKRFQFSDDRNISTANMEKLIDEHVRVITGEAAG